jgi:hypothetical protein
MPIPTTIKGAADAYNRESEYRSALKYPGTNTSIHVNATAPAAPMVNPNASPQDVEAANRLYSSQLASTIARGQNAYWTGPVLGIHWPNLFASAAEKAQGNAYDAAMQQTTNAPDQSIRAVLQRFFTNLFPQTPGVTR